MCKLSISCLFGKGNGFKRWNRTSGLPATEISWLWTSSKELWTESVNEINTKWFAHKKSEAITPVTEDFHWKWQQILYDSEKNLVKLRLHEANQVVTKVEIDLDAEIRKMNPKNYDQKYTDTTGILSIPEEVGSYKIKEMEKCVRKIRQQIKAKC